jgi:hypothetical protein
MPRLRVKFPGSPTLEGLLDVPEPNPQISAGMPMITILGSYDVQEDWLTSLVDLAEKPLQEASPFGRFVSYPTGLQALAAQAGNEQRATLHRFVELIRWRTAHMNWLGDHTRVISESHEWSKDSATWHPLDLTLTLTFSVSATGPELTEELQYSLNQLAGGEEREPLGWEIWNNALAARDTGDARAAVILSVSAVEIELKRLIGQLVPEAEWLIRNLPAPDIFKIVKDYLARLPDIPKNIQPTKNLQKSLQGAIQLRNDLIHVGQPKGTERDATIAEVAKHCNSVLAMASDLLWLFDAYRGHEWALEHLSSRTRETGSSILSGVCGRLRLVS